MCNPPFTTAVGREKHRGALAAGERPSIDLLCVDMGSLVKVLTCLLITLLRLNARCSTAFVGMLLCTVGLRVRSNRMAGQRMTVADTHVYPREENRSMF